MSDTYPTRIRLGYGRDTYPRRVRVSLNSDARTSRTDTYPTACPSLLAGRQRRGSRLQPRGSKLQRTRRQPQPRKPPTAAPTACAPPRPCEPAARAPDAAPVSRDRACLARRPPLRPHRPRAPAAAPFLRALACPTLQPAAEGEEGGGAGGGRWEGMGPVVEPPCRFCSLAPLQLLEALDREEQRKGAE